MKTFKAPTFHIIVTVVTMAFASGCGNDGNNGPDGADLTEFDVADAGNDVIQQDGMVPGDGLDTDDTLPPDANIDGFTPDSTDDADTFFTGTARIKGRAYFRNFDDYSGFQVMLWNGHLDDDGNEIQPVATVVTGVDGNYEFTRVPAGYYDLEISHGPLTREGRGGPYVTVQDGETVEVNDVVFTAVGAVTGTLSSPDYADWASNAVVYTVGRGAIVSPQTAGNFSLGNLLPGKYDVCVGATDLVGRCFEQLDVVALKTTELGEIVMDPWVSTEGPGVNVTGRATMFGMSDHSGIQVTYGPGTDAVIAVTDQAGNFTFENVRPGQVEILFDAPAGSGFETDSAAMTYLFYPGISEVLPEQTLLRGHAVWHSGSTEFSAVTAMFTPDSKKMILRVDENVAPYTWGPRVYKMYAVDLVSGDMTWLADSVGWTTMVTPDSNTVIYSDGLDNNMILSVTMDGSTRHTLATDIDMPVTVSPDSRFVIYNTSVEEVPTGPFAVNLTTGTAHHLCDGLLNFVGGNSRDVFCTTEADGLLEVVRLDDGSPVYSSTSVGRFVTSPDSKTAFVCRTDGTADIVNLEDGTSTALAGDIGNCVMIQFTPNGETVLYAADDGKLMAAPVGGGLPVVLDPAESQPLMTTPDSTRIIYVRTTETTNLIDLYVADVAGLQEPILLISHIPGTFESVGYTYNPAPDAFRVDDDSQAMFVTVMAPNTPSIELRHVMLDGSQVRTFGYVDHSPYVGKAPTWLVDEARGLVYMNQPFGKVRTMDIASGQIIHESDEGFGFGVVAPNLSGSLSISNSKDALVWLSFPELTYTLLKPSKLTGYPSYEEPGPDVMYSADGSMMMFRSDFGGTGGPIGGTIDRRVMIETLSEL